MHAVPVVPSGVERTFGRDEIIVSKTDPRGRITYANDVFLRVSGYTEADLLGRPHNVIRHPDMPRAVFQVLWDAIGAGDEVFAYVLNLAADGSSYWVLAHVTPTFGPDGSIVGHHSNRRWPQPSAVAAVRPLYRRLLEVERARPTAKAAVTASMVALREHLAAAGTTYDELVWSIISDSEREA